MALPAEKNSYTFADMLAWEEDDRFELQDGEIVMMAPPSRIHQEISGELFRQLANFLEGKKCRVYAAPFAVRLFEEDGDTPEDVRTVLEPDISVVCDAGKLDKRGCKGAPDLVIEILSPSTRGNDRLIKFNLYERAGVREYWIVDPDTRIVLVHTLTDGRYHSPEAYTSVSTVPVDVLDGCGIDLKKVFHE